MKNNIMNTNTIRPILFFLVFIFSIGIGFCQNDSENQGKKYVLLEDASGFDRSGYVEELENKTRTLITFFENEIDQFYQTDIKDNFKVFDFGFYLFNPITDGGIENALQIAEAEASQSSYYILFSKESNSEGIYSKIHIDIELPLGVNNCSTAEKLEQIENVLQEVANSFLDGNPFNYPIAVSETIDAALLMFGSIYCCEENGFTTNNKKSRSSACSVYSADQLGFLTFHNLTTTKTEFCEYSDGVQGLIERYNQCVMEDWLTYPEILNYTNNSNSCAGEIDKGIIPICLVENLAIQNGIPEVEFGRFAAGIVDGAYASIESIPDAVKGIGTLIEKGIEVQDAFTWAWLRCNPIFYKLNYQQCLEYEELIANGEFGDQNDPNNHLGGLFQRIKSKSKAEYYDILVTYIDDCDSKVDLRNDVISFFTDFDKIKSIFQSIRNSIGEYISSFNEDTRAYCSGRLVGNIIVGILGDKGISKVANLLSAFNKIQNALGPIMRLDGFPTDLLDDYAKLVKKFPNDFNKIPTSIIDEFVTDVATLEKFLDDFTSNPTFKNHILGLADPLPQVKAWKKVFKEGNAVSDILRKDIPTLEWLAKHGDDIPQSVADDLLTAIDKPIKETLEDAQGRLTYVLDRPGQSNKVVSVHPTDPSHPISAGEFKTTSYSPAYNPDLNPNIPVPLSANKLVPDYINTSYMHPLQGTEVVKIKLSGNRNTDFARARAELGISSADETVNGVSHTWHHMDDFEIINGEAYSTMQLVKSSAHQGTGVTGMQHSGSAAQWRAFFGSGY